MLAPRGSTTPAFDLQIDAAMIGRIISHYSIERPIGAGGMGQVYLARDLALGRSAAIKLVGEKGDPC